MALATLEGLRSYAIIREDGSLPPPQPGISWLWAQNGIFKRGVNAALDLCIPVGLAWPTPGLGRVQPRAVFRALPGVRVPGMLLAAILTHARQVCQQAKRPIEQQYFIAYRAGERQPLRVIVPPQRATAGTVAYAARIPGQVLIDIHSHHEMPAYFSDTDNRDDAGLSISCVIGRIFDRPEIVCRLNVWGDRAIIAPTELFDRLGSIAEVPCNP